MPMPSSAQQTSKRQLDSAGARNERICARQAAMNAASGAPKRNSIRPRPPAAMAASALVTSSRTICTRSMPPWAEVLPKIPAAHGTHADCGMGQHALRI
jgi:hypothetical protein